MKRSLILLGALVVIASSLYYWQSRGSQSQPAARASAERIVFNTNRDNGNLDIWLMDADGANLVQLTKNSGSNTGPQWNSDKSKIIFVSDRDGGNNELYIMNADGSKQTRLTNTREEEIWPSISPDTRYAYFARGPRGGQHDIWRLDLITDEEINITNTPVADELETFVNPEQTKIVFTSDRAQPRVYNCYLSDMSGSGVMRLTTSPTTEDHCMFNSAGTKISFARANPQNPSEWQIWMMDANGGNQEMLIGQENILNDCAEWSHDDTAIVLESTTDFEKNGDIYRYNVKTKDLVNLTPNTPDTLDLHPVW